MIESKRAQALKKQWLAEEAAPFAGWDFSRLEGRWGGEPLPWDYGALVRAALRPALELLDMGTGGGEFLLALGHPCERTAVTEGWEPNLALCRERLAPLGIRVEASDGYVLPFPEASFDIVINRHECYDWAGLYRVLRPGGRFITQQVGGENNRALSEYFRPGFVHGEAGLCLARERSRAEAVGFRVLDAGEAFLPLRFYDVGALVYFARIIEWEFPGFSVERDFEKLLELQERLEREGCIESREHRFYLIAEK